MRPEQIILHHSLTEDSQTVSWIAIRRYHTQTLGWAGIGYHFGIELVGDHYETLIGRPMNVQGAHTRGQNHNSIGICFVGNFDEEEPNYKQLACGIVLVKSLLEILNLTHKDVKMHRYYADYKSCPGWKFPFTEFLNQL